MTRKPRRRINWPGLIAIILSLFVIGYSLFAILNHFINQKEPVAVVETEKETPSQDPKPVQPTETNNEIKRVKVMANGDLLIHDLLYLSAYQADTDSYDFNSMFEKITPLLKQADLTMADFEGTISAEFPLGGYPIFNAPREIADAVKNAGYDIVSLANNHIVDSHSTGIDSTYHAFADLGLDVIGVNVLDDQPMLVKEVNGIKFAFLAYSYGFNGMDAVLTQEEYDRKLEPLNEANIEADIKKAEEVADVTIIYPHMGIEYLLEPTQEQIDLYHKMIDWGADVVFGNHPHVIEPTEVVQKDGLDKFILYSMGNFLSNQRLETVDNIWTERGVLMEVNFIQEGDNPVKIESLVPHPTWVYREFRDEYAGGLQTAQYYVLSTEDVINNRLDLQLDDATIQRIKTAHQEVIDLLNIPPLQGGQ